MAKSVAKNRLNCVIKEVTYFIHIITGSHSLNSLLQTRKEKSSITPAIFNSLLCYVKTRRL